MSRDPISVSIPDLSDFAKSLRGQLQSPPSHVELLGMFAKSLGYRNYQHLRAVVSDQPQPCVDHKQVTRALRYYDQGRFSRWPAKTSVQQLCLWPIWAKLPAHHPMSEREVSVQIDAQCLFKDAAQIRRSMVEHRLLQRTRDGAQYTRIEQAPPSEAQALIRRVKG